MGFAFLAKMLQAFLVLPGFAVAYLWAGPPRLGRRVWQTAVMGAGVIAGAGWWVLAAELTPAADRPYFGGSTDNNILQLAIGYNGLGRLTGNETGSIGSRAGGGGGFGGASGLLRLFGSEFGGQISWLLPAALIALAAMLWWSRRAARTDKTRAAALLWGGWVLVTGLVFSYMAGIGDRGLDGGGTDRARDRRGGDGHRRVQRHRPVAYPGGVREARRRAQVHYYVGQGGESFGGGQGSSAIAAWVAAHFTKLTVGGQTVYDLTKPKS